MAMFLNNRNSLKPHYFGFKQQYFLNPFHGTGLFLYPLKISENQRFSNVFQGVQKETSGIKWLNSVKACQNVSLINV